MIPMELKYLFSFLVALLGAVYAIPKFAKIARTINLMDKPGERRKVHSVSTPLVGGLGIVISATFSSMLLAGFTGLRGLFLGLALLLFVGFLDDLNELDSKRKFAAQIIAVALMMYFSNVVLYSFGNLVGWGDLVLPGAPWLAWLVTIFCVVGVINAVNLLDGLDGLAGGVSFLAFFVFAILAFLGGERILSLVNLAFAGAVCGFLRYNWAPASVFMGDAGSLCVGFTLAFMSIALTQGAHACINPVIPLVILAVPITDTITIMTRRIMLGRNPFHADHYHLHHILMRCGFSRVGTVQILLFLSFTFSCIAVFVHIYQIPEFYIFLGYCVYFVVYVILSFFIVRLVRGSLRLRRVMRRSMGQIAEN